MLLRAAMEARWRQSGSSGDDAADLPRHLKGEAACVRPAMLGRLAASRFQAWGGKAGVARAARVSCRLRFRADVRQRAIVKALVVRHTAAARGALTAHLRYLGRAGAAQDGAAAAFFDAGRDQVSAGEATAAWTSDRHHFRFIISPEHGDHLPDLRDYTRAVMARVADDLQAPDLAWIGVCHFDTDQPHAHVLVRGRRGDGRDLVIPRAYMAYGFRARAAEVAQERLGDLSRNDAERRIWRETTADRFTPLDRRLLALAGDTGRLADGVGEDGPWAALCRGRLRYLQRLGLAERHGREVMLAPDLETQLRTLQLRRDVIRTLHQRRLETGQEVALARPGRLRGRVAASGFQDEAAGASWAMVRDVAGVDRLVRLRPGVARLRIGELADLQVSANGLATVRPGRSLDRSR